MIDGLITAADYETACLGFSRDIIMAHIIKKQDSCYLMIALNPKLNKEEKEEVMKSLSLYLYERKEVTFPWEKLIIKEMECVKVSVEIWTNDMVDDKKAEEVFAFLQSYFLEYSIMERMNEEIKLTLSMEHILDSIEYVSAFAECEREGIAEEIPLSEIYNSAMFFCMSGIHKIHSQDMVFESLPQQEVMIAKEEKGEMQQEVPTEILIGKEDFVTYLKGQNGYKHVNVWNNQGRLEVCVMPGEETDPECDIISLLQDKVTIGTRISCVEPKRVAVKVKGQIYVHPFYQDAKEQIEMTLKNEIDYGKNGACMGQRLAIRDVYQKLSELECVYRISGLELISSEECVNVHYGDLVPNGECILFCERIDIDYISYAGKEGRVNKAFLDSHKSYTGMQEQKKCPSGINNGASGQKNLFQPDMVSVGFLDKEKAVRMKEKKKELYSIRGSEACIKIICDIVCGEIPRIRMKEQEVSLIFENELEADCERKLTYFLDFYKPVLIEFKTVSLTGKCALDDYCMLDRNAVLVREDTGNLDQGVQIDTNYVLQ